MRGFDPAFRKFVNQGGRQVEIDDQPGTRRAGSTSTAWRASGSAVSLTEPDGIDRSNNGRLLRPAADASYGTKDTSIRNRSASTPLASPGTRFVAVERMST
jgi:hypothetical protein